MTGVFLLQNSPVECGTVAKYDISGGHLAAQMAKNHMKTENQFHSWAVVDFYISPSFLRQLKFSISIAIAMFTCIYIPLCMENLINFVLDVHGLL